MIERNTIFSPCRLYRYTLWREWPQFQFIPGIDDDPSAVKIGRHDQYLQVIGLNPSTADERQNDPTVARCIDFAKRWGFGALCMTNAFAWRDTDPEKMKAASAPTEHRLGANDEWLIEIANGAGLVVAAWGKDGRHLDREAEILSLGIDLHCLGVNEDGTPKHPLYLRKDLLPIPYTEARKEKLGA